MSIGPFASATELLAAREAGAVSATELVGLYADRIAEHNPALNAVVVSCLDEARARAAELDGHSSGGALDGLPITIKDCIDVAGLPSTAGLVERANHRARADAPVTAAVVGAGAVVLGKTNVPPYAGDWQATNPRYGRTVNPWDARRTPGGSTGGGAAAVAAGLSALELGSDIGGSIRVPAAFCGLYGHRPSDSLVPRSGHFPGPPRPVPGSIMGVLGPLARSAADLELALDVIAGPEPDEPAWTVTLPPARAATMAGLRVAVLPVLDEAPVDDVVGAALEHAAATAARLGATVVETAPEIAWTPMIDTYRALLAVAVFAGTDADQRAVLAQRLEAAGNDFERGTVRGLRLGATELAGVLVERQRIRATWADFFRDVDVVLAPITLGPAFEHDDAPFAERVLDVNGEPVYYGRQVVYPAVATLPGLPATAFPVTRIERDGATLPIGLQAIGPYLEDRTPITFAALLERELGGFVPPPAFV